MRGLYQDEPWAKIPHWVVMHPDLDASAIRVYGILSKHANRERHAFPGIRKIAEECHCARSTVERSLKALEGVGAIVITRAFAGGRHKVNTYYLPVNRVPTIGTPDVPTTGTRVPTMRTPDVPTIGTEQDLKNQRTRELESSKPISRLPGESHKDYMLRVASLIPGLDK